VGIVLVAGVTAAISVLREGVPVLGLGVLYVFAVLPVAVMWGAWWSVAVAVGSMAAFNWFFLQPVQTFTIADRGNWLVLAVYVVTAIVVSELAARGRRQAAEASVREREDSILAELSTALLGGRSVADELPSLEDRIAALTEASAARLTIGDDKPASAGTRFQLVADGRHVATLGVTSDATRVDAVRPRFLTALGSLLAVALDRERLAREAGAVEELRRSDAIKTAVLRTISHDLRTPLTAIRVAAEGLTSPGLELTAEDRRGLLDTIQTEAIRLQRVVGDLLDLSRLEAGVAEPDPEVWMLDELLSQALDSLPTGVDRIDLRVPEDALVRVDAVQIERVLANLVENALKFSPPPSSVEIDAERLASEVVVHIVDHGPGMARGGELFEAFRTGDNGATRSTGLGLAIARGFTEANGGRLWYSDTPGGGATFSLSLPGVEAPVALPR